MRLEGYWGEFEAPYVSAVLICEVLGLKKPVEFLIDTGASRTTILDNDAIRLGIDCGKLQKFEPGTAGIGGIVDTFIIPDVKLLFRSKNGFHEEELKEIFVLRHVAEEREIEERIRRLPSLLGRDVLNKYGLVLLKSDRLVIITDEFIGV